MTEGQNPTIIQLGDGQYAIGAGGNLTEGYELSFSLLERAQEVGSKIEGGCSPPVCAIRFRGEADLKVIKKAIDHMLDHALGKTSRWTVVIKAMETVDG